MDAVTLATSSRWLPECSQRADAAATQQWLCCRCSRRRQAHSGAVSAGRTRCYDSSAHAQPTITLAAAFRRHAAASGVRVDERARRHADCDGQMAICRRSLRVAAGAKQTRRMKTLAAVALLERRAAIAILHRCSRSVATYDESTPGERSCWSAGACMRPRQRWQLLACCSVEQSRLRVATAARARCMLSSGARCVAGSTTAAATAWRRRRHAASALAAFAMLRRARTAGERSRGCVPTTRSYLLCVSMSVHGGTLSSSRDKDDRLSVRQEIKLSQDTGFR